MSEVCVKFCYVDESGLGEEPFGIMVATIVDGQRMHITKKAWEQLLATLGKVTGRDIKEFHSAAFYKGKGVWHSLNGSERSSVITAIVEWLKRRKHKITFAGIDKAKFESAKSDHRVTFLKTPWRFLAAHILLSIQKEHQKEKNNKGNSVFVFDREVMEEAALSEMVRTPPSWMTRYYTEASDIEPFDQIIDVPYWGDSCDVHLIQVSDLMSFILRQYVELAEGARDVKYPDESEKVTGWARQIMDVALPNGCRYSSKTDEQSRVFLDLTPASLIKLRK